MVVAIQRCLEFPPRKLEKMNPFLTSILSRGVGSTTNQQHFGNDSFFLIFLPGFPWGFAWVLLNHWRMIIAQQQNLQVAISGNKGVHLVCRWWVMTFTFAYAFAPGRGLSLLTSSWEHGEFCLGFSHNPRNRGTSQELPKPFPLGILMGVGWE